MITYIFILFVLTVLYRCERNEYEPMLTSADLSRIKEHIREDGYVNALPMSRSWTSTDNSYNVLGVRGDGTHHVLDVKINQSGVRYTVRNASPHIASMHTHNATMGSNINTL